MADNTSSLPAGADRWIGREIDGRYRIVERLGEGGMGAVFVAEHIKLRKQVALKTIRAEFAANSQAEARFAREALATAQLEHPHVASAIDYGHLPEGGAYLVIQLVRGEGLAALLERGPLTWQQAGQVAAQIADALAAAHAIGIVHRDLKPDNILLERRNDGSLHARVVDFGIARVSGDFGGAVADPTQPLTRMGAIIGTPGYMAPEQAVGQQVDLRADLYALGVILWESCAGRPLWRSDSLTGLLAQQLAGPAPDLREHVKDLPAGFAELVTRLLARDPAERPAAAAAVRDELRRYTSPALTLAPTPAPTQRPSSAPTAGDPAPTDPIRAATIPTVPPEESRRVPRAVWYSLAGVLLLVVVASALGLEPKPTRRGRDASPGPDTVPAAWADEAKALLSSKDTRTRNRAAAAIAGAPEAERQQIPLYLRDLAAFEKEPDCEAKRPILQEIAASGDARALPGLKLIAETPPGICRAGEMKFECIECLRDELAEVIRDLER